MLESSGALEYGDLLVSHKIYLVNDFLHNALPRSVAVRSRYSPQCSLVVREKFEGIGQIKFSVRPMAASPTLK